MIGVHAPASARIGKIIQVLERSYPEARCSLNFTNPLELLIATILSAQCTDVLVNKVTEDLFKKYKAASDYARANIDELAREVSRVTFYRTKARSIQATCRILAERFQSMVPNRMDDLLTLHGVARKTANVVLGNAFGMAEGIVVDTHVMRLSQRLGLSAQANRDKIEQDLMRLVPKARWIRFAHLMIEHGRKICKAKTPRCRECTIGKALCPSYQAQHVTA